MNTEKNKNARAATGMVATTTNGESRQSKATGWRTLAVCLTPLTIVFAVLAFRKQPVPILVGDPAALQRAAATFTDKARDLSREATEACKKLDDLSAKSERMTASLKTAVASAKAQAESQSEVFRSQTALLMTALEEAVASAKTQVDTMSEWAERAAKKARELDAGGDHAAAGVYWRNALERANPEQLLPFLRGFAGSVKADASAVPEDRFDSVSLLERMTELALLRVPPDSIPDTLSFREACRAEKDALLATFADVAPGEAEMAAEDSPAESDGQREVLAGLSASVDALLGELANTVASYAPEGTLAKEQEAKIPQLSGAAESAMSQFWFLDRSPLPEDERAKIDGYPKSLADQVATFQAKHDAPVLKKIGELASAKPPALTPNGPVHQQNVSFFTNQVAAVTASAGALLGADAQAKAQEAVASLMTKITEEKRQQMNDYQKFVANCCKLAFNSWDDALGTGAAGYGRVPKNKGFKDENDFIVHYVRDYAQKVPIRVLASEKDRRRVYAADSLIPGALQRKSGGAGYWNVANDKKAFIVTAIYGFYRIDQSLLTPESARLFNDVFGKYYEKMDEKRQALSLRWMVETPKVRLEDF